MKPLKRKICIYTSSRAEYGLLKGVMERVQESKNLRLQVLASGMHLSPEFGMTIQELLEDGFLPDETVEILLSGDTATAVCKSMGLGLISYGEAIQRLQPDIIVVLGDRFETFCMAAAAHVSRVPLAHIHGGEATEGSIDEAFRHSITKMSHLHFASCETHRNRIVQLGESPDRVFNVGALSVENIRKLPLMSKEELERDIGFDLGNRYFLATFHPVTLEHSTAEDQIKNLLNALDKVITDSNDPIKILFTKANTDTGGRIINHLIDDYVAAHSDKAIAFNSMGQIRYLSAMKHAAVVVGNSSSGIIEAPSFKVPTVNVGDRQKGRVKPESVINCSPEKDEIIKPIQRAISRDFRESIREMMNPYEKENTAGNIKNIIMKSELDSILKKTFFDIPIKHSLSNLQVKAKQ